MRSLQVLALTPPATLDPSIAIAASRAGAAGVLDLEFATNPVAALEAVRAQAALSGRRAGVRVAVDEIEVVRAVVREGRDVLGTIVVTAPALAALEGDLAAARAAGAHVLVEVTDGAGAALAEAAGVDGLVARGLEAGGWIGEETTFILLQRLLGQTRLPVWAHGGIGLHTAAACAVAGAAGVVLDSAVWLARESALPPDVRAAIAKMDGGDTMCVGERLGAPFRAVARRASPAVDALRRLEARLCDDARPLAERRREWRAAVRAHVGWQSDQLWPIGQDGTFAAGLARRFVTVGGVITAMRDAAAAHAAAARRLQPLAPGSPLTASHGTRLPILQGPMTRVSDTAAFAEAVADGGALPFLALALLRGLEVRALLAETSARLGARPWGVGILGFVPLDLRQQQLEAIRETRPPFALIAGGRPDQALSLEQAGIATYLHVPSPALLSLFLESGARRFVLEGRECGGHVGPRSSFVLWNAMIDVLLEAVTDRETAAACHVVFAGGIHDARSAAMVAAMAAPLAERGIRVGVLLGTAYLFTREAVAAGAITPAFQDEAIRCTRTVLLETGPGHATRCAATPFAETFERERRRLAGQGLAPEEIRDALEQLNLGRLRMASKGVTRDHAHEGSSLVALSEEEQRREGMYMMGQLAALRDRATTIAELHGDVASGGAAWLEARVETAAPAAPASAARPADVAIVGMACVLPKAPDLETFWANIVGKVDAITEIPADRFDWRQYFDPDPQARDKIYSRWGGFIDPVPFDPARYGMPPSSMPSIEPLQLLMLETVRRALADAGYADRPFARARTGVIVGVGGGVAELGQRYVVRSALPMYLSDVPPAVWEALPEWTEDSFAGIILNVAAGRVANRFDLGGVNYTVDAACASSLAALYAGVRELETGAADMMIVAAADTVQSPFGYLCFAKTRALSPRGRCRPFDQSADGIAIGEGVAVVVLKRLADAERDGDRIYAVIKSVAGSSDGRDRSMTAPRPEGQMLALERAYAAAGFSAATVGLIEAHGTGTVAGDRAEISALTRTFAASGAPRHGCAVGSVKSMIGHTKCAAGLAGLIKIAKAVYHKILPPTIGVEQPNTSAGFADGPFYVNTEARPWLAVSDTPRRAGVSAFGFGGTNFHAVIEEYRGAVPSAPPTPGVETWPAELFLVAGATRAEVIAAVDRLIGEAGAASGTPLRQLAASAWSRARRDWAEPPLTLAVVASSAVELGERLAHARARLADGAEDIDDPRGMYFRARPLAREGSLAFLFPGQGSQYPDMLREVAMNFAEVRRCFEAASRRLAGRFDRDLGAYVFPPPRFSAEEARAAEEALTRTEVAQPALGAAGLGMARLLQALGVRPAAVAGHSYGEYPALCAAGVLSEDDLYHLSERRGRAIVESAGADLGTMAAVHAGSDAVVKALAGAADVWIANVNGPRQTVIAGTRDGIRAALQRLGAAGLTARPVAVACAFHSPLLSGAGGRFAKELESLALRSPEVPVFSNRDAAPYPADPAAIAAGLAAHLTSPVRFMDEVEAMYAAGARIFVEVGPRSILTSLAQQILAGRRARSVATDVPGRSGLVQLLHALAQLAAEGVPLALERLFEGRLESAHAPTPPTPTTWLVSGGAAWPLHGARPTLRPPAAAPAVEAPAAFASASRRAKPAVRDSAPTAGLRSQANGAAARADATPAPPPVAIDVQPRGEAPVSASSMDGAAESPTLPASADGAAEVMLQFQRTMARFLETQRNVMLAFLGAETTPPAAEVGRAGAPAQPAALAGEPAAEAPVPAPAPARQAEAPVPVAGATAAQIAAPVAPVASPAVGAEAIPAATAMSADAIAQELVRVTSERTGYPPEMLGLDLHMEADLGIDSIKRVEILGALKQALPPAAGERVQALLETLTKARTLGEVAARVAAELGAAGTVAEAHPPAAAAAAPASTGSGASGAGATAMSADAIAQELVRVTSERTGYPPEMLGLDLHMEADLGIDSIKRVEILGALKQALPPAAGERVQALLETLTKARTLGEVAARVAAELGAAGTVAEAHPPAAAGARVAASEPAPIAPGADPAADTAAALPPRYVVRPGPAPLPSGSPRMPLPGGAIVITADARGVADAIARELDRRGARPVIVEAGDSFAELAPGRCRAAIEDPAQAQALVARLRAWHGSVGGLLHLAPVGRSGDIDAMDAAEWSARLAREVKGLFHLARAAAQDFAASPHAFVMGVTSFDGAFGFRGGAGSFPGAGGVAGIVKSLAAEWPGIRAKVVDVDPADRDAIITDNLLAELVAGDGDVEVGYSGAHRVRLRLAPAPPEPAAELPLEPESVVLVTGGARGITGEIAEELARRYRPTLILVGRHPLPEQDEPPALAAIADLGELRRALASELRRSGRTPTPAEVDRAAGAILRDREVRRRIAVMRSAGATVVYRDVDVRDAEAFARLIAEVYQAHGRLDGVIHGAGIVEDKLAVDKTTESFDRVFDTKALSAFALARALAPERLRFLVFFSSVSGRFGNRGQADYAAANEVLSALARRLDRAWPGRVVSIAWGPWAGSGMVSDGVARQFAARGIELIDPAAGRRMLDAELREQGNRAAEVVIGRGRWPVAGETPAESGVRADTPIVSRSAVDRGGALEFIHELDPARDRYLDDHRIDGKPVLPAAMAAELMAEMAAHGWPELEVLGIRGFRLFRGVVLANGAKPIRIRAKPQTHAPGDGALEVDVEIAEPGAPQPAYRGTVLLGHRLPEPPVWEAPGPAFEPPPLDAARAYRDVLFHGPRMHCIAAIDGIGPHGIAAAVRASDPASCLARPLAPLWLLDPIALDAAPQLAWIWAHLRRGVNALPARFEALTRFGTPKPGAVARCYLMVDPQSTAERIVADACFVDPDARVLLRVERLESTGSRALDRLSASRTSRNGGERRRPRRSP